MRPLLAAALVLVLLAPFVLADADAPVRTQTYVLAASAGTEGAAPTLVPVACVEHDGTGARRAILLVTCAFHDVPAGAYALSVEDDRAGPVAFRYVGWTTDELATRAVCLEGAGVGSVVVDLPEGCAHLGYSPTEAVSATGVARLAPA